MTTLLGLTLALVPVAAAAQRDTQAEARLQSAITKETVEGGLTAAIALYKQLAQGPNRAVAAKALVRLGACFEKQGNTEARKAYERAVREFNDQAEAAAQARTRLAAMGGAMAAEGPRSRLLWDHAGSLDGTASADGRYFSYVDWMTGDVAIRDLTTGEDRRVTNPGGAVKARGNAWSTVISPDAKRVAFLWNAWDEEAVKSRAFGQLHVINADGSGRKKLRAAWDVSVYSWSPDGKWLAGWFAAAEGRTPPKTLALWSAETGEERVLRTLRTELKRRIRFSPDGKWLAYDEAVEDGRPCVIYTLPLDGSATETELVKDATMVGWTPVGQGILFARQRENSSSLFVLPVSQGKAAGSPRQIYNASNIERPLGVTADGKLIYGLENKRADAWIGEIGVRTGELGRMAVQFPADNARVWMTSAALRFSPDGRQVMWSVEPNRIFIRSTAGEKQSSFTVQLTETRRVEWSHDGKALLAAGVGSDGRKGLYRVDPANGAAAFITGNLDIDRGGGAFVPSRDGNTIYYRTPAGKLAAFSPASGSERIIHEDFEGVPNMIVSHDGKRLAIRTGRWLGALVLSSGQYKRLYTRDFSTDHNVMWGLEWSTDDQKLLVIARDCRNAKCELWVFPAEGGEAIRKPLPAEMRGLSVRPEGKVATLRVENHRQVWVLENFLPAGSK